LLEVFLRLHQPPATSTIQCRVCFDLLR
jgi:hypothetical protein